MFQNRNFRFKCPRWSTLSSIPIGYNEYGHMQFDTTRSEIGELLYSLKSKADETVVAEIVETIVVFVEKWNPGAEIMVPLPPSTSRTLQPVSVLGNAISQRLNIPFTDHSGQSVFCDRTEPIEYLGIDHPVVHLLRTEHPTEEILAWLPVLEIEFLTQEASYLSGVAEFGRIVADRFCREVLLSEACDDLQSLVGGIQLGDVERLSIHDVSVASISKEPPLKPVGQHAWRN